MNRGNVPESWNCVDCGVNTAPGVPTRAEFDAAFAPTTVLQLPQDAVDVTFTTGCEVYIVRDRVWKAAGMGPWGGCLCIGCLEHRLGRRLTPKDFVRNHPFMHLPGTPRLIERRGGAA